MQTIIWAFGAMLLLLLIISFLPFNFNLKGKFTLVISAFTLALGGLAAVQSFPIWQTFLILFLLTFFASYILDSRLGDGIYQALSTEEETIDDIELPFSNLEKKTENDLLDLDEIEAVTLSTLKNSASLSPSELGATNSVDDSLEDLSIHLSDTVKLNDDESDELQISDGYLTDIENSLLVESDAGVIPVEADWLSELADLEVISAEENKNAEEIQLDDAELEVLFAFKESAVSKIDHKVSSDKKVILEK